MTDINSYIVDHAGYIIDSHTRAKCLADVISGVADDLDKNYNPTPEMIKLMNDVFGDEPDDDTRRAALATRLERAAEAAIALAAELRAPQIDERGSDKIGRDAKHSIV